MSNRQHLAKTRRELDELTSQCAKKISEDPKALGELSGLGKSMKDVPDVVLAQFTLRTASIILDTLLELLGDESGSDVRDEAAAAETEKGKEPAAAVSGAGESQEGGQEVSPGVSAAIPLAGGEVKTNRNQRRRAARKGATLEKH